MNPKSHGFLVHAEEDLLGAEKLRSVPRLAVYHLQQAAEKAMKAVLIADAIGFQAITHDLSYLSDLLPLDHPLKSKMTAVSMLTSFATAFRYPTPGGKPQASPEFKFVDGQMMRVANLLLLTRRYLEGETP